MAKNLEELNRIYSESEQVDQEVFAEQRSNLLLVAGEHYNRKYSKYWNRIRDNRDLTDQQKLRLTKNHTQVISKRYKNNIFSFSPGVTITAKNDSELQDQKSAELRQAVWQDAKVRYKLNKKIREWVSDFIDIGEVAVKIYFDPNKGEIKGYEQEVDEEGIPQHEEDGSLKSSGRAVYSGAFEFERIFGFNLLRDPDAKSMDESPYLIYRKMVNVKDLEAMVDDDMKAKIHPTKDETFMVFDKNSSAYKFSKDQTMLREHFYKPCMLYPNGYFYISTQELIIAEGELPFGIFPIRYANFDEIATSPRGRSIIKQMRPYQAEINRAASKIAEHQVTLGDDKLLIQAGTTLAHGGQLPGVRGVTFTGAPPVMMAGRDGSQYLAYMNSQITEMYQVSQTDEDSLTTQAQLEPYTLLYQSLKQKKVFSLYSSKFEEFLVDVCETFLRLHKNYVTDEDLILAVGRSEYINIPEYKQSVDLGYQIKIDPQVDDIETKMGKQLSISTILQYTGSQMDKSDIGKFIKNMPYANLDESFNDITCDYENAKNDILLLDRGGMPTLHEHEDHVYVAKRLVNRTKQPDFPFLAPQIQQNYQVMIDQHEQAEAAAQAQIAAAKSEYLPTGGYLVSLDFYVADPANPNKTRRARLPSQAVEWLISKLEAQGMSLEKLDNLDTSTKAQIAAHMTSSQQPPGSMDQGAGGLGQSNPGRNGNGNGNPSLNGNYSSPGSSGGNAGLTTTSNPYGLR